MARVSYGFTKQVRAEPVVCEWEPEPVDIELQIRSLYDSSWALQQGLLVIEGPAPDLLPDEWFMLAAHCSI
jgi:hypothetical protein